MKLHEEFMVAEPVGNVWRFFEQPEHVATCMPGVEHVTVLDDQNVQVRATQNVGPMTATFDARVTVLERIPGELIRFRAAGKSIRGAAGNVRTESTVLLRALPEGTNVTIDGSMVLAGALGSVGQKVIAKQASKVTAEFAANLRSALSGELAALPGSRGQPGPLTAAPLAAGSIPSTTFPPPPPAPDPWSRVAAALSAVSAVLTVIVLVRQRRRGR